MKSTILFLITSLMTIPFISIGQDKADAILVKLNKLYKENRVLPEKTVASTYHEIFLNKTNKTIDINGYSIPLGGYKVDYNYSYYKYFNKYMHKAELTCIDGDCIFIQVENRHMSGMGFFLTTKKACYDFINLLAEIKQALIPY